MAGLVLLLRLSLRVRPRDFPGIWFSLAWLAFYLGGQIAFFPLLGLLPGFKPAESVLADMFLAGIPVLMAGMLGFRRQPWGRPFAWPFHLGTKRRTVGLCLLGLAFLWLFDWAYMGLVECITHRPAPVQDILLLLKSALKAHPLAAFLAVAIMGPVVEEILFRGLLHGALEKQLPTGATIILTSVIFALYHFQMVFFIPLFGVGLLLGWARSKTGAIGLPILIHAVNNGFFLLLVIWGRNGS